MRISFNLAIIYWFDKQKGRVFDHLNKCSILEEYYFVMVQVAALRETSSQLIDTQ